MARIAMSNKKGSSLVELLVAVGILAVVAVALMQSSIIVLQTSVQNEMRDEAVRIAEQTMNELRSSEGGFVTETVEYPELKRMIRNAEIPFTVTRNVVGLDGDTKEVTVTVSWQFRGKQYNHTVTSIIRRY